MRAADRTEERFATARESETPWGLVTLANLAHRRIIPFSEEVAANLYQCVDCLGCWEACELDNNVPELLHDFRVRAFATDLAPIPLYSLTHRFREKNNPYRVDLAAKIERLSRRLPTQEFSRALFFAGCTTLAKLPEAVVSFYRLHAKLKRPAPLLFRDPVQCCGYPLYAAGDREQFRDLAEIQAHALADAELIVSPMPECVCTLKTLYAAEGIRLPAKVVHVVDYLTGLLKQANFQIVDAAVRGSALYHDSCVLARYLGCTAAPRDLLTTVFGVTLKEFGRHRDQTVCCGAMWPYAALEPRTAEAMAAARLGEVVERGVRDLVSASPGCVVALRRAGGGLRAHDWVTYVERLIV
jgi:Fe-S oxidoreductase